MTMDPGCHSSQCARELVRAHRYSCLCCCRDHITGLAMLTVCYWLKKSWKLIWPYHTAMHREIMFAEVLTYSAHIYFILNTLRYMGKIAFYFISPFFNQKNKNPGRGTLLQEWPGQAMEAEYIIKLHTKLHNAQSISTQIQSTTVALTSGLPFSKFQAVGAATLKAFPKICASVRNSQSTGRFGAAVHICFGFSVSKYTSMRGPGVKGVLWVYMSNSQCVRLHIYKDSHSAAAYIVHRSAASNDISHITTIESEDCKSCAGAAICKCMERDKTRYCLALKEKQDLVLQKKFSCTLSLTPA